MNTFHRLVLLGLLSIGVLSTTQAQGRFGFGFVLGEPTGLSFKYRIDRSQAIDGAIGFSPYDHFRIHADYLWLSRPFRDQDFVLHYGVGAVMGFGNTEFWDRRGNVYFVRNTDLGFGVRGVFGINYEIPRSPVEVYLELGPVIVLAPGTGVGLDAGVGVRFYP